MTRMQGAERQLVLDLRPRPASPSASAASQAPASVSDPETPRARRRRRRRHDSRGDGAFPRRRPRVRAQMRRPRVGRHRTTSGPRRPDARPPTPSRRRRRRRRFVGRLGRFRGPHVHRRARDRRVRARLARGAHVARGETLQTRDRRHRAAARVLIGKWVAFPDTPEEADALWSSTAREMATTDGALAAAGAHAAKVSSRVPTKTGRVICVYTPNYQDDESVFAVRDAIRSACGWGSERRMVYKPDVYTHLGLYAGNELNLRPSVHVDGGPPKEESGGTGRTRSWTRRRARRCARCGSGSATTLQRFD